MVMLNIIELNIKLTNETSIKSWARIGRGWRSLQILAPDSQDCQHLKVIFILIIKIIIINIMKTPKISSVWTFQDSSSLLKFSSWLYCKISGFCRINTDQNDEKPQAAILNDGSLSIPAPPLLNNLPAQPWRRPRRSSLQPPGVLQIDLNV